MTPPENDTTWETSRSWHLIRPLVYYLFEDFIPPQAARGVDALDFSAGLGDLSRYLIDRGARSVVSTVPEAVAPGGDDLDWRTGIAAGQISGSFAPASFDVAAARMVFQFPTWEGDAADPDTLVEEFAEVVRPGGRLFIAFHDFVPFEKIPALGDVPDAEALLTNADPGRAALVRYLGLPPREGPLGETGFGLKVPMLVTTLQSRGFDIEEADHPEPFTFPSDVDTLSEDALAGLGEQVMAVKRRYLSNPLASPYDRPFHIRQMLIELERLYSFATWPIVRLVARRR